MKDSATLHVNEIFLGVSGECGMFRQGEWVAFVRLAGCNLRCAWCDTVRAQKSLSGNPMTITEILQKVDSFRVGKILLTGGEPLMQTATEEFLHRACHKYFVQVETNGSFMLPASLSQSPICWVFDYKLPSSGMSERMLPLDRFASLGYHPGAGELQWANWVKFVIADREDYQMAKRLSVAIRRSSRTGERRGFFPPRLAFSACPPLRHADLFGWMKQDRFTDAVLSVQIHKLAELRENEVGDDEMKTVDQVY